MNVITSFFTSLDIWQILPSFVFLIAIIDPLGNLPITISMQQKGTKISPWRVSLIAAVILLSFLLLGDWILKLFGVQIEYFAIAGGFIIFLMALEMILDLSFFKIDDNMGGKASGDLVPLAFPMYAGPGTFTALIAMTAQYSVPNLIIAVLLCIVVLFIILSITPWLMKHFGDVAIYILRRFFGIIVLAIACQLMFGNLAIVLSSVLHS